MKRVAWVSVVCLSLASLAGGATFQDDFGDGSLPYTWWDNTPQYAYDAWGVGSISESGGVVNMNTTYGYALRFRHVGTRLYQGDKVSWEVKPLGSDSNYDAVRVSIGMYGAWDEQYPSAKIIGIMPAESAGNSMVYAWYVDGPNNIEIYQPLIAGTWRENLWTAYEVEWTNDGGIFRAYDVANNYALLGQTTISGQPAINSTDYAYFSNIRFTNTQGYADNLRINLPVPEPMSLVLLALGGLGLVRRRA